jgi:hypothetical protein
VTSLILRGVKRKHKLVIIRLTKVVFDKISFQIVDLSRSQGILIERKDRYDPDAVKPTFGTDISSSI